MALWDLEREALRGKGPYHGDSHRPRKMIVDNGYELCYKLNCFEFRQSDPNMEGGQMKLFGRIMISLLLVGLVLSFSFSSVQANKRIYKAIISTGNELHEVVGSSAKGSAVFNLNPDGSVHFLISVRGLTSVPTGGHIHGPADATQNAPVLGTLCGAGPNPGFYATCALDSNGLLYLEGTINGGVLQSWGVSGGDFINWLDDGLLYVNFHTALNPAGEARGQILPR